MPHGLEITKADGTTRLIDAASLGGTFVAAIRQEANVSQTHVFPGVPPGALRVIQAVPGNHSWAVGSSGSNAALIVTSFSQLGQASLFIVLAREAADPAFGVMVSNGSEQAANSLYAQPIFSGVGSISLAPFATDFLPGGYALAYHAVTIPGPAAKSHLMFMAIPSSSDDTWYSMCPAVGGPALATTRYYKSSVAPPSSATLMVFTKASTYQLPRILAFETGPVAASAEAYGIRVYNASGAVVFDSGLDHIYYARVVENFAYPTDSTTLSFTGLGVTPAVAAPEFDFTSAFSYPVSPNYVHQVTSYRGAVRRVGASLQTKIIEYATKAVVNNNPSIVTGGWGIASGLVLCEVSYARFGGTAFTPPTVNSPSQSAGGSLPDFSGESVQEEGSSGIAFNPNGEISVSSASPFSPNWFAPSTANIGASYWVRATRTGGSSLGFTGTLNAWLPLTTTRTFSHFSGNNLTGVYTFEFSTSASGSPIVRSCSNVSINVLSTN